MSAVELNTEAEVPIPKAAAKKDPLHYMLSQALSDSTPVRLRLLLVLNTLMGLFFAIVSICVIAQSSHAIKTIGIDAAPSVVAACEIARGVLQMENDLSALLLQSDNGDKLETDRLLADYESCRVSVSKQLVAAAENITYGLDERKPIEDASISFGKILMLGQSALDLHAQEKDPDKIARFRQCVDCVETGLLRSIDALKAANSEELEASYSQEAANAAMSCGFVLVVGLIWAICLFGTQVFLRQKFHRRLNLPILFALICLVIFMQNLYVSLRDSENSLRLAKEDSYDSISALLQARAEGHRAAAAQNRWLLDPEHAKEYEKQFEESANRIASFDKGHDLDSTMIAFKKQQESAEKISLPGFHGFLADELNNIRFEGEGEAAFAALQEYASMIAVDSKMRAAEKSGDHQLSRRLALGYSPDAGKYFFNRFDEATLRALKLNETHFKQFIEQAFGRLKGLLLASIVISLLVILLTYLGIRPRLAEYIR